MALFPNSIIGQAMKIQRQTVRSGSVKLQCQAWGNKASATRPAVILVHGYPDNCHVWDKTAALLADDYHVVTYDVRGAGDSDTPSRISAYRLSQLAEDFEAVIDRFSPDQPVHVVAHDWGSIQCWEPVTDPRLEKRIASFTSISGPSLDHVGKSLRQNLKSIRPSDHRKIARQVMSSWYIWGFQLPGLAPAIWKSGLDRLWPALLRNLEKVPEPPTSNTQLNDGKHGIKLYRANVLQRLASPRERPTNVPVQLIIPLRDHFAKPELYQDLPQWVPNLWRREIDAGHWLPLSHPEILASHVRQFVSLHEGGPEHAALKRTRVSNPSGLPFKGKLAIVTGAGSGIGRETACLLARRGAEVVVADINLDAAKECAAEINATGAVAHSRKVDVGSEKAMSGFATWVESTLGAPEIMVNNAGIGVAGRFLDTEVQDWEKLLRVNLWGVIHGARLFGKQMIAEGKAGKIVNVASAAAFSPTRTLTAYATTKAAVRMLSDCMRADLAGDGIHVVNVCPGLVNTPITTSTKFVGLSDEQQLQQQTRAQQMYQKRNLKPETVASRIVEALEHDQDEVLVGIESHGFNLLNRFLPRLGRQVARLDLAS